MIWHGESDIATVTTSQTHHPYIVERMFDGDMSTRWMHVGHYNPYTNASITVTFHNTISFQAIRITSSPVSKHRYANLCVFLDNSATTPEACTGSPKYVNNGGVFTLAASRPKATRKVHILFNPKPMSNEKAEVGELEILYDGKIAFLTN